MLRILSPWNNAMKQKLEFSELRYRRLFETAQDGILILDADSGKIVDVNPFMEKLMGYRKRALLGKELWQIGVFKDIVGSKAAFLQLQRKGYIRYRDLPLQKKNGKSIEVEFVSNVYSVKSKKVIQCNIRDITDRTALEKITKAKTEELEGLNKKQEETTKAMLNVMEDLENAKTVIESEKAKDDAIIESIGEGLIAVDIQAKIMSVNRFAENMLGWDKDEMIGKTITSFPLEDEDGKPIPFEKRPTTLSLFSSKPLKSTYYFVKRDKTKFPIAINVTPINLSGKTIGLIETLRDVTQEMKVDKSKTEFVSLASHQLRTPLGIMKWYLEAIVEEDYFRKGPENIHQYFDEIYKSNERVLSLVRDLLSVSRIDQGRVKNAPTRVDVVEVVKDIVKQMQISANDRKITLKLNIGSEKIPFVNIDKLRLHEVIENIVGNAIEYTLHSGLINVTLEKQERKIVISVKDNGIGISPSDKKKLFTKFFRAEKAIKHNPEGTGLGLYLVKSYVEGWGGKISANSIEGKGSTFTISLPISQKNEQERG